MVFAFNNLKFKISNSEKGITLVEIAVVIFIIAIFSAIAIANFPAIQRQYALSGATYKLAQDLRKVQDMGLSGVRINDKNGNLIAAQGYGIYIDPASPTQYIIYADIGAPSDRVYNPGVNCDTVGRSAGVDCAIETVKLSPNLSISSLTTGSLPASINFAPPGPTVTISPSSPSSVGISLTNGLSTRTVFVNTSGLINIQ